MASQDVSLVSVLQLTFNTFSAIPATKSQRSSGETAQSKMFALESGFSSASVFTCNFDHIFAYYACFEVSVNLSLLLICFILKGLNILKAAGNNYSFKFNNEKTRTTCEICSKFTTKTVERRED